MDFRGTEQGQTWLLKAEFGLYFEAFKPRVGRMFGLCKSGTMSRGEGLKIRKVADLLEGRVERTYIQRTKKLRNFVSTFVSDFLFLITTTSEVRFMAVYESKRDIFTPRFQPPRPLAARK